MKGFSFLWKLQVPLFFGEEGMFQELTLKKKKKELVFIEVVMDHLISLEEESTTFANQLARTEGQEFWETLFILRR